MTINPLEKIITIDMYKNKKKNSFVIGEEGTGKVRSYIKPLVSVKGESIGQAENLCDKEKKE